MTTAPSEIERLLEIMARLRHPDDGCPWDRVQTYATIAPYTIEEAYEVADAISRGDMADLKDELGDLLFQVVFYARMAQEQGLFDFAAIAGSISDKMVRRHPHVFEDGPAGGSDEALHRSWEAQKAEERASSAERAGRPAGTLDGVALALPALMRAHKLQKRAARVGFDWPEIVPVIAKVNEELSELAAEIGPDADPDRLEDEVGDVLFAAVNLARHLGVDSERALRRTNAKFERRFRAVEDRLRDRGTDPAEASLDEMEALWVEAKNGEGGR